MGKIEEHLTGEYLMPDDYILAKVLDKIKLRIRIEKFDDAKINCYG